jgi:hypothetical protein
MKTLALATDLKLPADEAVAQKYAFIGRSGSGKTYGAMKLAELFLEAEAQVIVLDWVGNWWALRLAQDGKSPGFQDVYIFGGEHADAPLEATGGAMMADLLVDKHISAVLDLSPFRKGERTRFATAFAEQLFHRKKTARTACHLVLEEAQAFLPQMVRGDDARMVGVFEDIGKVGRNYGIGVSILSQRPQAVNKDVLNQTEVLLAFQTNGPQERKTIGGWVVEHGESNAALVDELPTLARGDAFVWSPQWLQLCRRIHISARATYDASSTPTQKAKQVKPKSLTPADLEQLGEAMKATVETAKANDPRELKKQIAALQRQLKVSATTEKVSSSVREKVIEKPLLTDADRTLLEKLARGIGNIRESLDVGHAERFDEARDRMLKVLHAFRDDSMNDVTKARDEFVRRLDGQGFAKILAKLEGMATAVPGPGRPTATAPPARVTPHSALRARSVARGEPSSNGHGVAAREAIGSSGAYRMLASLAQQHPATCTASKLALLTGIARTGGTFRTYLGKLRTLGWVEGASDALVITDAGLGAVGPYDPLPTGDALIDFWRRELGDTSGVRAMFDAVVAAYPQPLSKSELAERTNIAETGGTFRTYLGKLRTMELIERKAIRASDVLFD